MGLDMYLTRNHYVQNWKHNGPEGQYKITVKKGGRKYEPIDTKKITYIIEEVAYWRKANHIHNWFVQNVQEGKDDCGEYYVDSDQLRELLRICKEIKDKAIMVDSLIQNGSYANAETNGHFVPNMEQGKLMSNPEVAHELLPTTEGFFFGGTDYDEYYMEGIDSTIEALEKVLAQEHSGDFYYRSSW